MSIFSRNAVREGGAVAVLFVCPNNAAVFWFAYDSDCNVQTSATKIIIIIMIII